MSYDCSFLSDLLSAEQVSFGDSDREHHATDWGAQQTGTGVTPDVVVWPESTDDVATVLAAANEQKIPVTPYAAGTSLEGNAVPQFAGISMDLTRMDTILSFRPADFQIDVEPGVMGSRINDEVASSGMFFPPLPSSANLSTIGGMIVNDASGQQTVKYGEIADWVLELEVVTADGRVMTCGSKAIKTSAGYNLKDLFLGSEGTLGVVTRATLQLEGLPEQIRGGRAVFQTLDDATDAVSDAVQSGVDVAKIELIDEVAAQMANSYSETGLPDAPMIFLEFHADHHIDEEVQFCRSLFESHNVEQFQMADEAEMSELWRARSDLAFALRNSDSNLMPLHPGDITVPISKLSEIIQYAKHLGETHDIIIPAFGHAGDGNVHYSVMIDPDDEEMIATGEELYAAVVKRAIELGGTATGEHGVGTGKRQYLELEHGDQGVEMMRRVKRAFDPKDILNPGKIFPETASEQGRVRFSSIED
jgi:D-lactate dehydrogenase (cytochrome)